MAIDRKTLILEAATQSFAQFGYKATTMDLVSKIANVGKGTIYTFFKTKEELFEEILGKAFAELQSIMWEGTKQDAAFVDNLFNVLDSILDFRSDHELAVKLSQEVRDIGTVQALEGIRRMEQFALDFLGQQLERAIDNGEVKPCNPAIAAFMILRLYIGLTSEWNKLSDPLSKDEIKQNMLSFIAYGIVADPVK
ncbi:transcriptional regulator, TetR family [Paenibacillus algorifonticola]|uniref:Transcriptional regulator, TetR family n=1 Tax=Paenibacillus algorifonticola TaxID=684063 RepID=A0A1I2GK93_9BACL|nr:TetR/AcrR family transcriptional regulator [Paenibacillus algorifonticola]SFF17380.1 transcriptional regulator, TetR family [Paenibacillus algorifonticola]